jgi:hypothetical protein
VQFDAATLPRQRITRRALQAVGSTFLESAADEDISSRMDGITPPEEHLLVKTCCKIPK